MTRRQTHTGQFHWRHPETGRDCVVSYVVDCEDESIIHLDVVEVERLTVLDEHAVAPFVEDRVMADYAESRLLAEWWG